ncbi:N-6 DNA methylase [Thiocystis violacea]|uniref:N-6 DNA methylase n=1 Tax=Thiocystis violacea TaxID=13725 RepID=UPI001905992F|nr:N-6 DNA methylase [Thiocystis violacea]MBK1717490.1 hypothetical protein [Thiocystis violacea]
MSALRAIERGLRAIGYRPETLHHNYRYADVLSHDSGECAVALAAFTQIPASYRSAAFGVVHEQDGDPSEAIAARRALGAPLFLSIGASSVNVWRVAASGAPVCIETVGLDTLDAWFGSHADRWNPQALHRAKSTISSLPRQMDFVDLGLMPAIEHEVQSKLDAVLREVLRILLGDTPDPAGEDAAFRATFRLLAAKILRDREHAIALDWASLDVGAVLQGIAGYYRLDDSRTTWDPLGQQRLETAWGILLNSVSLRNISADSLAFVYENTLVTSDSRKRFGTHGTPRRIADFALSRLDLGRFDLKTLRIYEPFAGAAAFLLSAVRQLHDLLPTDWSPETRHEFLTARVSGGEVDAFACEVAVLSLILADYPAQNGWRVRTDDLFAEGVLEKGMKGATVVLCNPPFETFTHLERSRYPATVRSSYSKAQFALARALEAAPEALAFVMPHGLLRQKQFGDLRSRLSSRYRSVELMSLPEGTFGHAQFEAALVIAKEPRRMASIDATRVLVGTLAPSNGRHAQDDVSLVEPRIGVRPAGSADLWVGALDVLWDALASSTRLRDQADVHRGLQWWHQSEGISESAREGFRSGIFRPRESLRPYRLLPLERWLNFNPESLRRAGPPSRPWNKPKALANAQRISRGRWRISAAADASGLAASQQFFGIWPRAGTIAPDALAAILNSPIANAYVSERTSGQHLTNEMLKDLPMPAYLNEAEVLQAVADYRAALNDWDSGVLVDETQLEAKLRCIDELVLAGYGLGNDLRRLLFDYFAGQRRPVDHRFSGWDPVPAVDPVRAGRERALARGRRQMMADLATGGEALSAQDVARLLGGTVDEIQRLTEAGALLALPNEREPVFPSIQFREGAVLDGLIETLAAFPDTNPWARLNYLVNPDLRLGGRRPIDCLKAGEIGRVVAAARQVGEQSAA